MAVSTYDEFDTTYQNLFSDLYTKITADSNWDSTAFNTAILTSTASSAAAATTLTFTSGAPAAAGVVVGSVVRIGARGAADTEYRTVTAVAATTITVAALTYPHGSGTSVFWADEVFTCTTSGGAAMKINLLDTLPGAMAIGIGAYNSYTPGTTTAAPVKGPSATRSIYWRTTGGEPNHPLHITLSLSQDHMFIGIEGPRAGETGAMSATLGSMKGYFFASALAPYHAGDDPTPVYIVGGSSNVSTAGASSANRNWEVHSSFNWDGDSQWSPGKLMSLSFPSAQGAETIAGQRVTKPDNAFYFFPYVFLSDEAGVRGRLTSFFYGGINISDNLDASTPQIGAVLTYGGDSYKLQAVSKSEGATVTWGPFGSASNGASGTYWKSPIVAVPVV